MSEQPSQGASQTPSEGGGRPQGGGGGGGRYQGRDGDGRPKRRFRGRGRRKVCRFCADKTLTLDYKWAELLEYGSSATFRACLIASFSRR